jgi:hypothetical protein
MQITGMLHGARLLEFAGFPTTEVLGPAAFPANEKPPRASVQLLLGHSTTDRYLGLGVGDALEIS